jgi:hypothetical protein
MRTLAELDELPVSEWTEEEGFMHLSASFEAANKEFPDFMERYVTQLAGAADRAEETAIMRLGLRETFRSRFP